LFRNLLKVIKEDPLYQGYRFSLLGNRAWRSVAETLDADLFDKFFWIDPTKYSRSSWYRVQVAHSLVHEKFDTIVQPAFSRTSWNDRLVRDLTALHKIAGTGDKANRKFHLDLTRQTYTRLVPVDRDPVLFEFERNKEFVEGLLGRPVHLDAPFIEVDRLPELPPVSDRDYVVFHMDASRREKEWPGENFAALARWIVGTYSYRVVLLGQGAERTSLELQNLGEAIVDLRDKTTLVETARILSGARGFVGNDSALLHMALAVGVPGVVGICFGQHFGRFVPYPEQPGKRRAFLFPPRIQDRISEPDFLKKTYAEGRFEDIAKISLDVVLENVNLCLK